MLDFVDARTLRNLRWADRDGCTRSKAYRPGDVAWTRPIGPMISLSLSSATCPTLNPSPARNLRRYMRASSNTLVKDRDSYGPTHPDAHGNNFVDEGPDHCLTDEWLIGTQQSNWYVNDLAVVLFYIVRGS